MDKNIYIKIKKLGGLKDINILRYELYSIFTTLLFSKDLFRDNKQIKLFLEVYEIQFKDYVMKSRTLIVAKVLKKIDTSSDQQILFYSKELEKFATLYHENTKNLDEKNKSIKANNIYNKNKSKDNYMESLLKKYTRNR